MHCRVGYLMSSSGAVRPTVDLNFLGGGLPTGIGLVRLGAATTALYTDPAGQAITSYALNVPRIDSRGLLAEIVTGIKNFLLHSEAPVTQTTASLSTGTYVLFGNGSTGATLVSTAGTATATGLGTLNLNTSSYQVINVTVAGTLVITTSGTVNWFDLQNYAVPTSHITTVGSAVTRSADILSYSGTIPSAAYGMIFAKAFMPAPGGVGSNPSYMGLTDGTSGVVFGFVNNFGQSTTAGMLYTISGVSNGDGTTQVYPKTISGGAKWTPTTFQGATNGVVIAAHTGLTVPSDMTTLTVSGGFGSGTNANAFMGFLQKFSFYAGQAAQSRFASIAAGY